MPTATELYDEADQLKEAGKVEEAVAKLEELLAEHADYSLAHSALVVLCGKVGRHEEAVRHAVRVCELEPNVLVRGVERVYKIEVLGRGDRSISAFDRARSAVFGLKNLVNRLRSGAFITVLRSGRLFFRAYSQRTDLPFGSSPRIAVALHWANKLLCDELIPHDQFRPEVLKNNQVRRRCWPLLPDQGCGRRHKFILARFLRRWC